VAFVSSWFNLPQETEIIRFARSHLLLMCQAYMANSSPFGRFSPDMAAAYVAILACFTPSWPYLGSPLILH
jgi:hypothetical protein